VIHGSVALRRVDEVGKGEVVITAEARILSGHSQGAVPACSTDPP